MSLNLFSMSFGKRIALGLAGLGLLAVAANWTQATIIYTTSISGSQIDKVDTSTNTVSLYLSTLSAADSIMFDTSGRVIYDQLYSGTVRRYDPNTATDTLIASGFSGPADMVLEPGGNSMLVSEFYGSQVDRINLNTNAVSVLPIPGVVYAGPEGLAYDGSRLFVNLGARGGGPTGKYVAEVNPITGAIIGTTTGLDSLDGLTYDPYSNKLYACSVYGNLVYSIDPNNLSSVSILTAGHSSTIAGPDGITTDGLGNIFVASSDSLGDGHIYDFNLTNSTLTQDAYVSGLDDLAPASGLGSMVPEPGGLSLFFIAGASLIRRRRNVVG